MTDRFNASGTNGRDCPICFRAGTLVGLRQGGAPRLTCSGCRTQFAFTFGDGVVPDTLTRIPTPTPAPAFPGPLGGRK